MTAVPTDPGELAPSGERKSIRLALMARLRAYFFAGILVTAPISITIYLAWLFVSFVDARVTPLLPARFNPESYLPFAVPGLGLLIVIVALTLIGASTAGYFGRALTRFFDTLLARMPVIRSVYGAIKQIVETVLAKKSSAFRQAVLIQYPRYGIWTIGFLTGVTEGEVQAVTQSQVINVFVPTTPNPTSGFLLFVPRAEVVPLAMSVEDALKMVVSGGIVTPPVLPVPAAREEESATPGEKAADDVAA
ncbi:MAG: DUF502 domain-containing protein [Rhodospirillales bacterium]|nr:DUF502 domain-containing protein [Rhodospirillales bacterium]